MARFIKQDWSPGYLYVCPHHVEIRVKCEGCGKEAAFDRVKMRDRIQQALVTQIESRLKCSGCGAKKARMMFGYLVGDD